MKHSNLLFDSRIWKNYEFIGHAPLQIFYFVNQHQTHRILYHYIKFCKTTIDILFHVVIFDVF